MVGGPAGADLLVGRDDELDVLRAAFDAAAGGRPTIVLVMGDAGIGKTRLADEAAVLARGAGMRVLRGEADAATRQPMELWRAVYRALDVPPAADPSLPAEERRWEHLEALSGADPSMSAPTVSDVPVLILEGAFDAATAPGWVDLVTPGLARSQYVEFPFTGHSVLGRSTCSVSVMGAFLDQPTQPVDGSCAARTELTFVTD